MMPVPYSEMKGFRNCSASRKGKPCACCCCENVPPTVKSKSKSKCIPSKVGPLNMIESEYIKNLQLQIYYLEMESKYLWKRTQDQNNPKKTESRSYDPGDYKDKGSASYWDKNDSKYSIKANRESPATYSRSKYDDLGKYKSSNYDKPTGYSRPCTYKASSYKTSAYTSPSKYDDTAKFNSDYISRGSDINNDLDRLIKNVKIQDEAIKNLTMEKTRLDEMLDQEKQSHTKDLRNVQEDLARLRAELENERQQKARYESELNRLTGDMKNNEDNLRQLDLDRTMLQNQMAQRDQHLRSVKSDLEDARSGLEKRESEINDLQDKYNKSHDLFNRVAAEMREEHKALKEHLSNADMKIQELESNRDVLVENNQRLIKENASLDQEVNSLEGRLHQDRNVLVEKEKQREMAAEKITSMANDIKNIRSELQDSKQKVSELDGKLRETMDNLYAQESQNERLEQRLSSATNRVSELESIRESLAADIRELQDEKSSLLDRTSLLESELCYQRGEVEQLQNKSQQLNMQLKDVEDMKNLQNSLQTQKWSEFGKLANSMQNLSRCMTHNTGTTVIIETE